jgi:tetratricopeptide (TPR) repeat protein
VSANPKAVFLSYTSQDAEVALRICEALRAAGVDVWFDQSELRGGDAWDASIRTQIKECALFVPIISANTETRTEGYFRLEWRLAEQRSHLMAKGRPFILPVVIDATSENGAHVPDAFMEVQWSRLAGGQSAEVFAAYLQKLLSDDVVRPSASRSAASAAHSLPVDGHHKMRPRWLPSIVVVCVIAALGIGAVVLNRQKSGSTAVPAAPSSVAELVAKSRALLDDDPLTTRRNIELGEQLSLEAIARDSTNAEAFAVAAWANFRYLEANYEDTPKRRADLRSFAEKAKLLGPDSINAELAMCAVLSSTKNDAEAIKRLLALADRAPANLTLLRTLVSISLRQRDRPETEAARSGQAALARLRAVSPLGKSYADSIEAARHWGRGEYIEADRLIDAAFATGQPVRNTYLVRLLVRAFGWGDLAGAREFAAGIPSKLLLEDAFVTHTATVLLLSGDFDQAMQALNRTQRELLQEARIQIPTASLRGDVHAAAGRQSAAAIQWREALKIIDRLLQEKPDSIALHDQKQRLLASLGDRKAATAEHALVSELGHFKPGSIDWAREADFFFLLGDTDAAIARFDRLIAKDYGRWAPEYHHLLYQPSYKSLRNDPRIKAILKRGAGWMDEMRQSAQGSVKSATGVGK